MSQLSYLSSPVSTPYQLLVFTRYPTQGFCKTRLIPALGSQGAADLHRQLTEWAIAQGRICQQGKQVEMVVCYTGATDRMMQQWLGADLVYRSQGSGDLGEKLHRAFVQGFETGKAKIVIVGTDCPHLTPEGLKSAFEALQQYDLVLGPAYDGGYYLIGLRRAVPELFAGIEWGSSQVWTQTMAIAHSLGLTDYQLPFLPDIDRPEDLIHLPPSISPLP